MTSKLAEIPVAKIPIELADVGVGSIRRSATRYRPVTRAESERDFNGRNGAHSKHSKV
jgi:hypothetical protein